MPATLTRNGEVLEISLKTCRRGTSEFGDTLAKIKEIPGRRFDGTTKLWSVPAEPGLAERILATIPVIVEGDIEAWVRDNQQEVEQELLTPLPEDSSEGLLIPWSHERAEWQPETIMDEPFLGLKAHQRSLIEALVAGPGQAIVADDMGLGKTATELSTVAELVLRERVPAGPKLVVCPNSVKGVWAREARLWLGPDEPVVIIDKKKPDQRKAQLEEAIRADAWVIVNYEQLRTVKEIRKMRNGGKKTFVNMKEPLFESTPWSAIIADEAHRAKNRKASQTKGLFRCRAPVMIAATGTPIMNSPDELWALLHWLFPIEFGSYWRFHEQFVEETEGYRGKVVTGVKNPDALRFVLRQRLFRRTKDQVLDLPEKQRVIIPLQLDSKQRKLYTEAERNLWLEVEKAVADGDASAERLVQAAAAGVNVYTIPNGAARTVRLRQILSTPSLLGGEDHSVKLDACVEQVTDNSHKQHVVFSEFVDTCSILAQRLSDKGLNTVVYTGEVKPEVRTEIQNQFQAGEIDVVVGTIGAMREGITLTAADTVHFIERAWVPGWNEQAEDRLHRIGQKNAVTVYIYEAQDTVDDNKVMPTNRLKEKIVRTVLPKDHVKETR